MEVFLKKKKKKDKLNININIKKKKVKKKGGGLNFFLVFFNMKKKSFFLWGLNDRSID